MYQVKMNYVHFLSNIQLFEIDLHFLGFWSLSNTKYCDGSIIGGG